MTTELSTPNQQGLDIQSTPREEMKLYPLDTFAYEFPGREIKIKFEMPEFTCIVLFPTFPTLLRFVSSTRRMSAASN